MSPIQKKTLRDTLTSKAFWLAVLTALAGLKLCLEGDTANGFDTVLLGLMAMAGRHKLSKMANGS